MPDSIDYSIRQKLDADVIDESPNTYLVRFPNGDVTSVARASQDGILCSVDSIDPARPVVARGQAMLDDTRLDQYGATGLSVAFQVDIAGGDGEIVVDSNDSVTVTGTDLADLLLMVSEKLADEDGEDDVDQANLELTRAEADRLFSIYEEMLENRVRDKIVEKFEDAYYGLTEVTYDGWIIHDAYLLTYEAENYLIEDHDTFHVSGGRVVETDAEPQGIKLRFDAPPMGIVEHNGDELVLSQNELEFLATAEVLTSPSDYLGVDSFEREALGAVEEAIGYRGSRDLISRVAETVDVQSYVDPKTGLMHRHEVYKHTLKDNFGVASWVINDLHFNSWDHAGVAELAWREDELREADRNVFMDTDNDDPERWDRINRIEKKAPCPPHVYKTLEAMYGSQSN